MLGTLVLMSTAQLAGRRVRESNGFLLCRAGVRRERKPWLQIDLPAGARPRSARTACTQPRTPPGRQLAPAASTVGATQLAESALHVLLGCAADPRWVCILECAAPPVRGWVPASLTGVESSFLAHSNREPCSRREVATTRTLRRARITPARPAQRLMRARGGRQRLRTRLMPSNLALNGHRGLGLVGGCLRFLPRALAPVHALNRRCGRSHRLAWSSHNRSGG